MKKMTISRHLYSNKNVGRIIGKETLRVINVHDSFVGIGKNGEVNRSEFQKLADFLEPSNTEIKIQ